MRAHLWFAPIAVACLAFIGRLPYSPGLAIAFADQHWNWAEASGAPAPVASSTTIREASRVPAPGWFQPAYECAEFVGRALHAGGVPVPEVPSSNSRWPVLVNVDRLSYFLLSRGWAHWTPISRVKPGDAVIFRYQEPGRGSPPTVWSHMALVVGIHPVILDAHNAAHRHIRLTRLAQGAYAMRALSMNRRPQTPSPMPPANEVQVAWRDVWTSAGTHLYWGQVYRLAGHTDRGVRLAGVPGTLPDTAVAPVATTPTVRFGHAAAVVLGLTPRRQAIIATARAPVPAWTGRGTMQIAAVPPRSWYIIPARTVEVPAAEPLEPIPGRASLPKAWMPAHSVTVVDGLVRVQGQLWAQVEWRGAELGLGFVPWHSLKATRTRLIHLRHPMTLMGRDGSRVTLRPPASVAEEHGRFWYAGALLSRGH